MVSHCALQLVRHCGVAAARQNQESVYASKQRLVREEKDINLSGGGCRTPGLSLHHSLVGVKPTRPVAFK